MVNRKSRDLLARINEVSFVLDDVKLFLDTHPMDLQAQKFYLEQSDCRNQLMQEYAYCVGPLTADMVEQYQHWTWINDPWPWEGEV